MKRTGHQGMPLVKSIQTQMKHWKPLLSKLNVETGDDVEMIGVVEGYALRYMLQYTYAIYLSIYIYIGT